VLRESVGEAQEPRKEILRRVIRKELETAQRPAYQSSRAGGRDALGGTRGAIRPPRHDPRLQGTCGSTARDAGLRHRARFSSTGCEERLTKLEAPKEEERFLWTFKDWQEMLKVVTLPLTLLYGGLQFYDEVWTRGEKQQAAAAAAGQESLRELQAMNAEIYRMRPGQGARKVEVGPRSRGRRPRRGR